MMTGRARMEETTVATAVDGETAAAEPSSDTIGGGSRTI
jgi:hypothetical protein